ncbi:hypothetical protein VHEMI08003 [[Torrubiella] hemipterigena]|uniref:INO80 complex subunit B-like conserved region domain-containing protein n=1 Tax=[Torrubiella] hemipterigena TaxID=1531966 RepID=A0A0A1T5A6_9HYPO|nr:hypothetical protein VHEMI08003 [[Torrubiella] hemipterigena]
MTSRPRRSAATKASENISEQTKWQDNAERSTSSRRSGRGSARFDEDEDDDSITVRMPSGRQAARSSSRRSDVSEVRAGTRNRGTKKNYVVDSSPDDEEEDEEDEDEELDEDGEGDDNDAMEDVDAEGDEDEDAEGDTPMDSDTAIRVARPPPPRSAARAAASKMVVDDDDDDEDEDEELSDADSNMADGTMGFDNTMGDETMGGGDDDEEEEDEEDEDAEGDDQDAEGEAEGDGDEDDGDGLSSDEDGVGTPNLAKMTKRQRARFEDEPQEYMKLSDEVQVKKHFTAEELSMRRQEMARRRRNLSEKRNEEVKMETINKLLKKQARKISKKALDDSLEGSNKPKPTLIRWVSTKDGSRVAASNEIMEGPAGTVFGEYKPAASPSKMVEEVA